MRVAHKRKPTRAEINAAHRMWEILFAPSPNENKKETEMVKKTETEIQGETGTATALAVQEPAPVAAPAQRQPDSAELTALGAEALRQLEEAAAQLRMGFTHVAPSKILERGEAFHIIDAIQTEIPDEKKGGELKTVFVFMLETETGDVLTMMQSYNTIRAKWAEPFVNARLARACGVNTTPRVGPLKLGTRPAKINDAITFDVQRGFRIDI